MNHHPLENSKVRHLLYLTLGIVCLFAFVFSGNVLAKSSIVVKKNPAKIGRVVKSLTYKKCESLGDPHYLSFSNVRYDHMGLGDYILAQSSDGQFIAHSRTSKWGGAAVNSNIAIKMGSSIFEYDVDKDVFYVDGVQYPLSVGETKSIGSGSVKRVNAQTALVTASNGVKLTMSWYRNSAWKQQLGSVGYISVIIDAPSDLEFKAGLCLSLDESKKTATGILHNHLARKVIRNTKPKKETPERKKVAIDTCKKAGLNKKINPNSWSACVKDAIQSGQKIGLQIGKTIKKVKTVEEKAVKKAIKKRGKKAIKKVKKVIKKNEQKARKLKKAAKNSLKKAKRRSSKCSRQAFRKAKQLAKRAKRSASKLSNEKKLLKKLKRKIKSIKKNYSKKNTASKKGTKCIRKLKRLQRKVKRALKKVNKAKKSASKKGIRKAKKSLRRSLRKLRKHAKKMVKHMKKLLKKAKKNNKSKKVEFLKKVLKRVKKIASRKSSTDKTQRLANRILKQARKFEKMASKKISSSGKKKISRKVLN